MVVLRFYEARRTTLFSAPALRIMCLLQYWPGECTCKAQDPAPVMYIMELETSATKDSHHKSVVVLLLLFCLFVPHREKSLSDLNKSTQVVIIPGGFPISTQATKWDAASVRHPPKHCSSSWACIQRERYASRLLEAFASHWCSHNKSTPESTLSETPWLVRNLSHQWWWSDA